MTVSAEHRSKPAETSKGNSDFSKRVNNASEVMKKNNIPVNSLLKSSFCFTFPFHFKKKDIHVGTTVTNVGSGCIHYKDNCFT